MSDDGNAFLKRYLDTKKKVVDEALDRFLPGEDCYPSVIFKAMRYSIFAGGKRIRPALCLAAAEAVSNETAAAAVLPVACALELIHTYSLIHDDLPAMDDDDCRRGKATSHKMFGENIAILAGDALLTEAFHLMAGGNLTETVPVHKLLTVIGEIAEAAGHCGMVGGQVVDIQSEGKLIDAETLHYIHTRKTGALIAVSVRAGAMLAGADQQKLDALAAYGSHIGLVFQIADDILNVDGDRSSLGKNTGSDATRGKLTFPALIGMEASRQKAREIMEEALAAIQEFDLRADPLRMIARYIVERNS